MLFNSFPYILLFLPAVIALTLLARKIAGPRAAQACVLLASLIFYTWWKPIHLPYLAGSILANWLIARQIAAPKQPHRKRYLQLGLMRAAAAEYAGTNLTINAISPSMIETRFLGDIAEVAIQMSAAANPRGRNATPHDILGAIEFLLSPASDYMTGVDLPLTAGSTC